MKRGIIKKEIIDYLESGNHIVDGKEVKSRSEVTRDVSNNILAKHYGYSNADIEKFNEFVDKDLPLINDHNTVEAVKASILPGIFAISLIAAETAVSFILKKEDMESLLFKVKVIENISSIGLYFTAGYGLKTYLVNRKSPYSKNKEDFDKNKKMKDAFAIEERTENQFAKMEHKRLIKKYGYGRSD